MNRNSSNKLNKRNIFKLKEEGNITFLLKKRRKEENIDDQLKEIKNPIQNQEVEALKVCNDLIYNCNQHDSNQFPSNWKIEIINGISYIHIDKNDEVNLLKDLEQFGFEYKQVEDELIYDDNLSQSQQNESDFDGKSIDYGDSDERNEEDEDERDEDEGNDYDDEENGNEISSNNDGHLVSQLKRLQNKRFNSNSNSNNHMDIDNNNDIYDIYDYNDILMNDD